MSSANPLWGSPRIVGELAELGIRELVPRYLVRDRDRVYGLAFKKRVTCMGIEEVLTAPRSPWQNPFAERVIGSIRRECRPGRPGYRICGRRTGHTERRRR
jgi:hypothetical protein